MKYLYVDNIGHSIQMKKDDNLYEDPGIYLEDIVGWVLWAWFVALWAFFRGDVKVCT